MTLSYGDEADEKVTGKVIGGCANNGTMHRSKCYEVAWFPFSTARPNCGRVIDQAGRTAARVAG